MDVVSCSQYREFEIAGRRKATAYVFSDVCRHYSSGNRAAIAHVQTNANAPGQSLSIIFELRPGDEAKP